MKISNIKEGRIYTFKNIDSLNSQCDGEKILVKKIIDEDNIIIDFTDYKKPILKDVSLGIIEYRPLLNMIIRSSEVRR